MATEKLVRAVVSGPVEKMDEAIRTFMLDREFQPMQASTTLGGRGELQVPDCDDIYRPALESAVFGTRRSQVRILSPRLSRKDTS